MNKKQANGRAGRRDQRVEMCAARLEAPEPTVGKSGLEAADERPDAASKMRQRCQHSELLRSGRQDTTTFTCRGDSAFEIADGCRHLGVGRIAYFNANQLLR
jgi:hypothetical protein